MVKVVDQEMKRKERDIIGRRFVSMKSLMAVLMGVAVLLVIFSYATVSTGWELPLGGETPSIGNQLKLLSMDIPLTGNP